MQHISSYLEKSDLVFLKLAELNDYRTFEHSVNVGRLVEIMLTYLKDKSSEDGEFPYNEDECKDIIRGAYLHDIGKNFLSFPFQQLPKRLTELEYQFICQHPVIGEYLLNEIGYPKIIRDMCLYHHSIPDNENKYPIYKEDTVEKYIELICLIDKFEAMSAVRSYKNSIDPNKCLEYLEKYHYWGWKTLRDNLYEIRSMMYEKR